MSVTAAALWTSARARVGLNFTDGRLDDENIDGVNTSLNAGLSDLCTAHDWDWLYAEGTISVVNGTEGYAVPTNHIRTLWIANDFNEELRQRQRRDAIRYSGATGYPRFYSILNTTIYLTPVPNQNATFRMGYYAHFNKIAAANLAALAGITLAIPDMYVSLATMYVAKNIAMMFKDYDAYQMLGEEIRMENKRIVDNTRRSLGPIAPQARVDWIGT